MESGLNSRCGCSVTGQDHLRQLKPRLRQKAVPFITCSVDRLVIFGPLYASLAADQLVKGARTKRHVRPGHPVDPQLPLA